MQRHDKGERTRLEEFVEDQFESVMRRDVLFVFVFVFGFGFGFSRQGFSV